MGLGVVSSDSGVRSGEEVWASALLGPSFEEVMGVTVALPAVSPDGFLNLLVSVGSTI